MDVTEVALDVQEITLDVQEITLDVPEVTLPLPEIASVLEKISPEIEFFDFPPCFVVHYFATFITNFIAIKFIYSYKKINLWTKI